MGRTKTVITRVSGEKEAKAKLDNLEYLKQWGFSATNCAMCGISNSEILDGLGLLQCARCRKAHYCGVQCLQADFQDHIQVCGLIDIGTGPRPPENPNPSDVRRNDDQREPTSRRENSAKKVEKKSAISPKPPKKKKKGKKVPKETKAVDDDLTVKDKCIPKSGDAADGNYLSGPDDKCTPKSVDGADGNYLPGPDDKCTPKFVDGADGNHLSRPDDSDKSGESKEQSCPNDLPIESTNEGTAQEMEPAQPGVGKLQLQDVQSPEISSRPGVGKIPSTCIKCFDGSNKSHDNLTPKESPRKWQPPVKPAVPVLTGGQGGPVGDSPKLSQEGEHSEKSACVAHVPESSLPSTMDNDNPSEGQICSGEHIETVEGELKDGVGKLDAQRLRCHSPQSTSTKTCTAVGRLPSASIKCFDNDQGVPNKLSPKASPRKWKSSKDPRQCGSTGALSADHELKCSSGFDDNTAPRKSEYGANENDVSDRAISEGQDGDNEMCAHEGLHCGDGGPSDPSNEQRPVGKLMSIPTSTPKSPVSRKPGKLPLGSVDVFGDSGEVAAKLPRGVGKLTSDTGKPDSTDPKNRSNRGSEIEHEHIDDAQSADNRTEPTQPGHQPDNSGRRSERGDRDHLTTDSDGDAMENIEAGSDTREVGKLKMTTTGSPKSQCPRKSGKLPRGSVDAFEDPANCVAKFPRGAGKSNKDAASPGSLGHKNWQNGSFGMDSEDVDDTQTGGNLAGSTETGYPALAAEVDKEESDIAFDDAVDNTEDGSRGSRGVGKLTVLPTASPNSLRQRKAGKLPQGSVDAFEKQPSSGQRLSRNLESYRDTSNTDSLNRPECFGRNSSASEEPAMANTHGSSCSWTGSDRMDSSKHLETGEDCEGQCTGKLKATSEDDGAVYSPKTRSVGKLPIANIGCFEKEDTRRTPGKLCATSFASSALANNHRGQNSPRNPLSPRPPTGSVSPTRTPLSPNKLPSGATKCFDSPRCRSPRRLKSADHLPQQATDCFENPVPTSVQRPVRSSPGKLKSFAIRAFAPRTPNQDKLPPAFSAMTSPRRKWTPPRRPVAAAVPDVSENDET